MVNIGYEDLTGKTFGHLKVICVTKDKNGKKAWLCECDCENKTQVVINSTRLTNGSKQHCGCRRTIKRRDEIEFPKEYLNRFKTCNTCGEEKEYKEFYFKEYINKNGIKKYYFNTRCIDCDKKQAIIWANNNIEKKRESCRKNSYKPNIREYHKMNSERQRSSGYRRKWEENSRDKLRGYCKQRNLTKKHEIYNQEWESCKKYFNYQCAYCGKPIKDHVVIRNRKLVNIDFHKEHVVDDGKNDLRNCIPSCQSCNSTKNEKTFNEFYNPNNPDYTYERYHKIYMWLRYDHKKFLLPKRRYKNQHLESRIKEIENNKIINKSE